MTEIQQSIGNEVRLRPLSPNETAGVKAFFTKRIEGMEKQKQAYAVKKQEKDTTKEQLRVNKQGGLKGFAQEIQRKIKYGDTLTDYESDYIAGLEENQNKFAQAIEQIDKGDTQLAQTIVDEQLNASIDFLNIPASLVEDDIIHRQGVAEALDTAAEEIEVLKIIAPKRGEAYYKQFAALERKHIDRNLIGLPELQEPHRFK